VVGRGGWRHRLPKAASGGTRLLFSRVDGVPILFECERFVIVDKPTGVSSVPGKGPHKADCVVARVRAMFPRARGPLVVHRLDMETSGLLVVALDPDAQRELSACFERRDVEKRYVAVLEGQVVYDAGEVNVPIRLDPDNRPYQVPDFEHGRSAVSRYTVRGREPDRTRVEFRPVTGRSHQLRVHSALPPVVMGRPGGLGCPIVGDGLYGDRASGPRLMLHATYLRFTDPGIGRETVFESRAPF